MSYTTKDAVKMAMEGSASKFQEAISDLLMDKVRDAVDLKKIEIASSFMSSEMVEEEVEIEEETLSEERYTENEALGHMNRHTQEAERHERFAIAAKQHGDTETYKKEMNAARYHKKASSAHEHARAVHGNSAFTKRYFGGVNKGKNSHDQVVKAHQDAHSATREAEKATEDTVNHHEDNRHKYSDDYKKKINQVASAPAHHMDYHRGYDPESKSYHKDHAWAREGKPAPKED